MIVRNEKETDHRHVEELIRKAFYNLYVPGCTEHYLARVMRGHEDFIPELDLVLELDGLVGRHCRRRTVHADTGLQLKRFVGQQI